MTASNTLGPRALNRALLARQLLLGRAPISALEALERLIGVQAQAPGPPYIALWTRLTDFDPSELSDLIAERHVVRIALQRGTLHAVRANDALVLRPLLQPVFERWLRQVTTRLGGASLDAVAAAARVVLEDEPLTFAQVSRSLAERWPNAERAALGNVARGALALVQVPPRGLWGQSGPAAHTTIESWLGAPLDRTGALDDLLVRYLAAFGPAHATRRSGRGSPAWPRSPSACAPVCAGFATRPAASCSTSRTRPARPSTRPHRSAFSPPGTTSCARTPTAHG